MVFQITLRSRENAAAIITEELLIPRAEQNVGMPGGRRGQSVALDAGNSSPIMTCQLDKS